MNNRRDETIIASTASAIRHAKPGETIIIPHGMTWTEVNAALDQQEPTELARARWWASGWARYTNPAIDRYVECGIAAMKRHFWQYDRRMRALNRLLAATDPNQ